MELKKDKKNIYYIMGHFVYILYGNTDINYALKLEMKQQISFLIPFSFLFKHIERLLERLILLERLKRQKIVMPELYV